LPVRLARNSNTDGREIENVINDVQRNVLDELEDANVSIKVRRHESGDQCGYGNETVSRNWKSWKKIALQLMTPLSRKNNHFQNSRQGSEMSLTFNKYDPGRNNIDDFHLFRFFLT